MYFQNTPIYVDISLKCMENLVFLLKKWINAKSCSRDAQFNAHSITTENSPYTLHLFWAIVPNQPKYLGYV